MTVLGLKAGSSASVTKVPTSVVVPNPTGIDLDTSASITVTSIGNDIETFTITVSLDGYAPLNITVLVTSS